MRRERVHAQLDAHMAELVQRGLVDPGVAQRVRVLARLREDVFVSGEWLAGELGISRAAISKHVGVLSGLGLPVEAQARKGYRLASSGGEDSLVPESFILGMAGRAGWSAAVWSVQRPFPGLPYHYFREVGSTNDVLKQAAEAGMQAGAIAVADFQTQGRGRLGRSWVSEPAKDLTFSVLLRPRLAASLAHLAVVAAGLAVAAAVAHEVGDRRADQSADERPRSVPWLGVKWPNDVMLGGKKVSGVLTEASLDMDRLHWLVIGIGVNVNSDTGRFVGEAVGDAERPTPISLCEATGKTFSRPALLFSILDELATRMARLETGDTASLIAELEARDVLRGHQVSIRSGRGGMDLLAAGTAAGFRDDGALLILDGAGTVSAVLGGDVTLR